MAIDFVEYYAKLVRNGLSINKVPAKYREAVRQVISQL